MTVVPMAVTASRWGFAPIWEVLTNAPLRTAHAGSHQHLFVHRRAEGGAAGAGAAIDTLVSAQNINASTTVNAIDAFATTENQQSTQRPQQFALPVFTDIPWERQWWFAASGTADRHYNKLGNHRFLRFTPAAIGQFHGDTAIHRMPAANPDPDFMVYRSGTVVEQGQMIRPPNTRRRRRSV